jgi:hypothetical protein
MRNGRTPWGHARDALIDPPELGRGTRARDGNERDVAREFAAVRGAEVELSVLVVGGGGGGDEGDADEGGGDGALRDEVVGDGWDAAAVAGGALCEVVGADAEDAVEA